MVGVLYRSRLQRFSSYVTYFTSDSSLNIRRVMRQYSSTEKEKNKPGINLLLRRGSYCVRDIVWPLISNVVLSGTMGKIGIPFHSRNPREVPCKGGLVYYVGQDTRNAIRSSAVRLPQMMSSRTPVVQVVSTKPRMRVTPEFRTCKRKPLARTTYEFQTSHGHGSRFNKPSNFFPGLKLLWFTLFLIVTSMN